MIVELSLHIASSTHPVVGGGSSGGERGHGEDGLGEHFCFDSRLLLEGVTRGEKRVFANKRELTKRERGSRQLKKGKQSRGLDGSAPLFNGSNTLPAPSPDERASLTYATRDELPSKAWHRRRAQPLQVGKLSQPAATLSVSLPEMGKRR